MIARSCPEKTRPRQRSARKSLSGGSKGVPGLLTLLRQRGNKSSDDVNRIREVEADTLGLIYVVGTCMVLPKSIHKSAESHLTNIQNVKESEQGPFKSGTPETPGSQTSGKE